MNFLYLKMLASRRSPHWHLPLGHEGLVEETLARRLIQEGAAREIKAPEFEPLPDRSQSAP
jgi:hypothetical protein